MLEEIRARALDFASYVQKADMNAPTMKENFEDTRISEKDREYFDRLAARLPKGAVSVLALSESWCGDCVENVPVFAKVAQEYPFLELLIVPRDTNMDIMDRYLTNGKPTIPVFVFFDESGEEFGRFVERPPGAHKFMEEARSRLAGLPPEEQKKGMYKARADLRKLYKAGLRDETIGAIRGILEKKYGS
ncbi:MAG TPA: thioredoxin family protein [Firmicutes bacterium]|nr:thioredoxin family protein [Candidatus Fermentithermobacillaceae bacterium]